MKSQSELNSEPLSVEKSSFKWRIRVPSSECAFVYQVLEAHEGICAYSTLAIESSPYRDLELLVPVGFESEMRRVIAELKDSLNGELYDESQS